ncbi:MAG: ATP-binding protein [Negativicutes bacterium]|nr:ATP-binding protein [Negativicutes bacterium]
MTDPVYRQDPQFLCDAIPAAVIAINPGYQITLFNKGAETLFGADRSSMLGQDLRSFFALRQSTRPALEETLSTGVACLSREQTLHFNGRSFPVLLDVTPLFDPDRGISGALAMFRDVAHIREDGQRLHHLEILAGIGEMSAGTIHEIRNPLTSVSGYVQLLQLRAARAADETSVGYCRLISEEINHINTILSDFLTLAKPQSGKIAKIDIVRLVQDVLTLMYGEALLFNMTLVHHLPTESLYLLANREKIKEVLINLCRNAFQAMVPGGTLTITVSADADNIRITLSDTGHGMADATIANIFKPFFTTKEAGTGLGLAICQKIMHDHNGEITVTSEIGHGSTFTLTFPRLQDTAA